MEPETERKVIVVLNYVTKEFNKIHCNDTKNYLVFFFPVLIYLKCLFNIQFSLLLYKRSEHYFLKWISKYKNFLVLFIQSFLDSEILNLDFFIILTLFSI